MSRVSNFKILLSLRKNMLKYAVRTRSDLPAIPLDPAGTVPTLKQIEQSLNELDEYQNIPENSNEFELFMVESINELFDESVASLLVSQIPKIFFLSLIPSELLKKNTYFKYLHLHEKEIEFLNNKMTVAKFMQNIGHIATKELNPDEFCEIAIRFIQKQEQPQADISSKNSGNEFYNSLSNASLSFLEEFRRTLNIFDFILDREIVLMLVFFRSKNLTRRSSKTPHLFDSYAFENTDVCVLNELIDFFFNKDSCGLSNFEITLPYFEQFWYAKIEQSIEMTMLKMFALLTRNKIKTDFFEIGVFGCRNFELYINQYMVENEEFFYGEKDLIKYF